MKALGAALIIISLFFLGLVATWGLTNIFNRSEAMTTAEFEKSSMLIVGGLALYGTAFEICTCHIGAATTF